MPLFRRIDPDLRALIAYIVAQAVDRGITLNRTRLVKLLYLTDVESVRGRGVAITGLNWVFFHYGPYAFELIDTLDAMDGAELVTSPWGDSVLYRAAPDAPDAEDWKLSTRRVVDRIVSRFVPLDLNELLDYVYFRTGPMVNAQRGQPLDLSLAREDRSEQQQPPLRPPAPPSDLEQRLGLWRARNAHRLRRAALDPAGVFLDDTADDLDGEGVRGILRTPDATEL